MTSAEPRPGSGRPPGTGQGQAPGNGRARTRTTRAGSGHRRREIIEAAAAAFHDFGYDATSMQDIADRVGMLKGSLYHHISSKEDLLAAVLQDTQTGGLEIVRRHVDGTGSCRERLRGFVVEYTLYCIDNRIRSSIFDREFQSLTPAMKRELIVMRDEFDGFLRTLLRDGMRAGELARDLDVVITANVVYGAMNTIYRWYSPAGSTSRTAIAEHVADLVDRMVKVTPEPA